MLRPRPCPAKSEPVHLWHIFRPGEADAVLALSASRIVVTHSGGLLFLDNTQQLIFAMAPGTWTSVERVPGSPETTRTDDSGDLQCPEPLPQEKPQ